MSKRRAESVIEPSAKCPKIRYVNTVSGEAWLDDVSISNIIEYCDTTSWISLSYTCKHINDFKYDLDLMVCKPKTLISCGDYSEKNGEVDSYKNVIVGAIVAHPELAVAVNIKPDDCYAVNVIGCFTRTLRINWKASKIVTQRKNLDRAYKYDLMYSGITFDQWSLLKVLKLENVSFNMNLNDSDIEIVCPQLEEFTIQRAWYIKGTFLSKFTDKLKVLAVRCCFSMDIDNLLGLTAEPTCVDLSGSFLGSTPSTAEHAKAIGSKVKIFAANNSRFISDDFLRGLSKDIRYMDISSPRNQELKQDFMSHFGDKLERLDLSGRSLTPAMFRYLPKSVTNLRMNHAHLNEMDPSMFVHMNNVIELRMRGSLVSCTFPLGSFDSLSSLALLDISESRDVSIETKDIVSLICRLRQLDMSQCATPIGHFDFADQRHQRICLSSISVMGCQNITLGALGEIRKFSHALIITGL